MIDQICDIDGKKRARRLRVRVGPGEIYQFWLCETCRWQFGQLWKTHRTVMLDDLRGKYQDHRISVQGSQPGHVPEVALRAHHTKEERLMKCYRGSVNHRGDCVVEYDGFPIPLRLDLRNHSPSGFNWGYSGSGPSQLALALLAHCLKDDRRAKSLYMRFKLAVIAELPQGVPWRMTGGQILNQVKELERLPAQSVAQ